MKRSKRNWLYVVLACLALLVGGGVVYSTQADARKKCTGSSKCTACKNCKYCKHCAKEGGTCGVCD